MNLTEHLRRNAERVESELDELLAGPLVKGVPERLIAAMRHAVLDGGKRLRPSLVLESAALLGVPYERAVSCAAAVELVHCYSLVHDDLPAMDNDRMRRGKPTVWAAFDEWTAILAGDALQTLAFQVLAEAAKSGLHDAACTVALTRELAAAAGASGMVGGQVMDLEAGKLPSDATWNVEQVTELQALKTGRLIRFSCEAGALLAGRNGTERACLRRFGDHLGLAFQIADDLLDAQGDATTVGKAVAKDAQAGKATLVSVLGIEAARGELDRALQQAQDALRPFGSKAEILMRLANFVARRDH